MERDKGQFNDRLPKLRDNLIEFIGNLNTSDPPPEIMLFGSLGRRLAISGANNWNDYLSSIDKYPQLLPRENERANWDADVAIPGEQISWQFLTNTARRITLNGDPIEIDPHFINLDTGERKFEFKGKFRSSDNLGFVVTTTNFEVAPGALLEIPDIWSQMLFYLSSRVIRTKDLPEIIMLAREIRQRYDPSNPRYKEMYTMLRRNKALLAPVSVLRIIYHLAVPYDVRVSLAIARGGRKASMPNYESPEPVWF